MRGHSIWKIENHCSSLSRGCPGYQERTRELRPALFPAGPGSLQTSLSALWSCSPLSVEQFLGRLLFVPTSGSGLCSVPPVTELYPGVTQHQFLISERPTMLPLSCLPVGLADARREGPSLSLLTPRRLRAEDLTDQGASLKSTISPRTTESSICASPFVL